MKIKKKTKQETATPTTNKVMEQEPEVQEKPVGRISEIVEKQQTSHSPVATPALLEVFLCIADASRPEYTRQTLEYWMRQHLKKEVEMKVILPIEKADEIKAVIGEVVEGTGISIIQMGHGAPEHGQHAKFQRDRRMWAQRIAKGEWYVVADDDCVPKSEGAHKIAMQVITRHEKAEEFGVLVMWPENAKIYPWRPGKSEMVRGEVYMDSEIWEHVSVGGIRFVQKAAHAENDDQWTEQPKMDNDGKYRYDRVHADMLRGRGYRSGLLRGIGMTHLGEAIREDDSGHPEHPTEPDFEV